MNSTVSRLLNRRTKALLSFDGVTNSARAYWTLGTVGALGTGDFTVAVPNLTIPRTYISTLSGPFAFADVSDGYSNPASAPWCFIMVFNTDGSMYARIGSDANSRTANAGNFTRDFGGQTGTLTVRRVGAVVTIWWKGISLTLSNSTVGSAPAWSDSILCSYLHCGALFSSARSNTTMGAPILINGALSDAEILYHAQTGQLPNWCNIGTGSMVNKITDVSRNSDFSAGVTDWSGAGSNTRQIVGGALELTALAANGGGALATGFASAIVVGCKYRWTITVTGMSGSALTWNVVLGGSNEPIATAGINGTGVFVFEREVTTTGATQCVRLVSNGAAGVLTIDNIEIRDLGPVIKPVLSLGYIGDTGANAIVGTITAGASVVRVPV